MMFGFIGQTIGSKLTGAARAAYDEVWNQYHGTGYSDEEVDQMARNAASRATPTIVYDPFGRLQSPTPPRGQFQAPQLPPSGIQPVPLVQAASAPVAPPAALPMPIFTAPQAEIEAFIQQIRCMEPSELAKLKAQLEGEMQQLNAAPPGQERNLRLVQTRNKISRVNMQRLSPQPCELAPGAQVSAAAAAVGVTPTAAAGAAVTPIGPAMPDRPSTFAPEVSLRAPVLDLYQQAALREIQREEERVRTETEALARQFESLEPTTLETQPEEFQEVWPGGVPTMPTMAPPAPAGVIEEAEAPGPEVMSATADVEEVGGPNWLLIAAVAAVGLMAFRRKKAKKKKA